MPISIKGLCPISQCIWILRFKYELSFATDYLNSETSWFLEGILIIELFNHALIFVLLLLLFLNDHYHAVQPFKINQPRQLLALHVFIVLDLPIAQDTHAHAFFLPNSLKQTSHLRQWLCQRLVLLNQINVLCRFLNLFHGHHLVILIIVIQRGIVLDIKSIIVTWLCGCGFSLFANRTLPWGHVRQDKGLGVAEMMILLTATNHTLAHFLSGWCGYNRGKVWRPRLLVDGILNVWFMRDLFFEVDTLSDHSCLII